MAVIGITGSTDGIGRATARVLLADGRRVLVYARSRERGNPLRKHWVALSLWWLATWRGLMTSVDWPTRPASTARTTRGCTTRAYGCGAARR
jgi:nucleoside-diphosphate-sugar epimerase